MKLKPCPQRRAASGQWIDCFPHQAQRWIVRFGNGFRICNSKKEADAFADAYNNIQRKASRKPALGSQYNVNRHGWRGTYASSLGQDGRAISPTVPRRPVSSED